MFIEQAIYGGQDGGGYRFLARSPGFADGWLPEAQRLCTGFGDRLAGTVCPIAVFAQPFGPRHVAVVQAADQGLDDAGRPGTLGFRLLVLPRSFYADLGGDPFLVADHFPPAWDARGDLPALSWTAGPPPKRTVEQVRRVIDVSQDRTALLLGGAQVLVDGGRLVFERNGPDPPLLRDLWTLLPTATRTGLWPASFAFANHHRFHVLATPKAGGPEYEGYVPESQAGDYPEGRYELALQTAVEAANQAEMDALFARRSRAQVLRLGVVLALVFLVASVVLALPFGKHDPAPAPPTKKQEKPKPPPPMKLPRGDVLRPWSDEQRKDLADRLQKLAGRLQITLPGGDSEKALADAVVELDRRIDAKMGANRPTRDPGKLSEMRSVQLRLRALLWKHDVAEYAEPGLNPLELMERLEKNLEQAGVVKEDGRE